MHRINECYGLGFLKICGSDQISATGLVREWTGKLKLPPLPETIEKGVVRLDYGRIELRCTQSSDQIPEHSLSLSQKAERSC